MYHTKSLLTPKLKKMVGEFSFLQKTHKSHHPNTTIVLDYSRKIDTKRQITIKMV